MPIRRNSVDAQYQLYFATAALAAHSNHREKGFRQKDLRFLIELFSNWMNSTIDGISIPLHNIQISRYLESLVEGGMSKLGRKGGTPRYRLTRAGVIGLLQEVVERKQFLPLEQFFFLYYFVQNYGDRVYWLAEVEGAQLPKTLKLELDALRDPEQLLTRQLRFVDRTIAKLNARIGEGVDASDLATSLFSQGSRILEVVNAVQRQFPYELNHQKPLPDLFAELPDSVRRTELEEGARNRALGLWTPLRDYWIAYRKIVESL